MDTNLVPRPMPANRRAEGPGTPGLCGGGSAAPPDHLVEDNLGFVIKVACEYRGLGLPLGDLVNEGCLGLIQASARYDPKRGVKFVTYAGAWVRKWILQALARYRRTIRVPVYHLEQVRRYKQAESLLASQLGRRPGREEVCARLATPDTKVDALLRRSIVEMSLETSAAPGPEGRGTILGKVEDKRAGNPELSLLKDENRLLVDHALLTLSQRERFVIERRYGLKEERLMSLAQVAAKLGLSRERVRQIENQARMKMRRVLLRKRL